MLEQLIKFRHESTGYGKLYTYTPAVSSKKNKKKKTTDRRDTPTVTADSLYDLYEKLAKEPGILLQDKNDFSSGMSAILIDNKESYVLAIPDNPCFRGLGLICFKQGHKYNCFKNSRRLANVSGEIMGWINAVLEIQKDTVHFIRTIYYLITIR